MFSFGRNKEHTQIQEDSQQTLPRDTYQESTISQTSLAIDGKRGGNLELKIVKPTTFSEVTTIADYLLDNYTVFLDLETTSSDTIRRILDFLTGVSYAAKCSIKKVSATTFILTPSGVNIREGEQEASL